MYSFSFVSTAKKASERIGLEDDNKQFVCSELRKVSPKGIVSPMKTVFMSANSRIKQKDIQYYVDCYSGTKEG